MGFAAETNYVCPAPLQEKEFVMKRRPHRILVSALLLGGISVLAIGAKYCFDMRLAYERVRGSGTLIQSPYGDIEYTEGGSGPDVLVIHGSGGGYDQGEIVVEAALDGSFHWISPSRFGYLRSTFNEGATFDDQARAYAYLLDHLEIKTVAVVAISHGGPSALLFAVLYPERVSSLSLISCGVAPSSDANQTQANERGSLLMNIFQYDIAYWALTGVLEERFMELMGANEGVVASLDADQKLLAEHLIDYMNPVSLRAAGARFDNGATMPGERIRAVRAPTLILHAIDDTLQLYHNAEFAASRIPNARLVRFERGGHLLFAVERPIIAKLVQEHIRNNARP